MKGEIMNSYRKDRFRHRRYFDSFPIKRDQAMIIGHYLYAHYNPKAQNFNGAWFEALNKLIYRVAHFSWIVPSKVSASVICNWIYLTMNRRAAARNWKPMVRIKRDRVVGKTLKALPWIVRVLSKSFVAAYCIFWTILKWDLYECPYVKKEKQ